MGGPGGDDETMKHGGEFGLKWLDDMENVDDPHNTGAFVKAPEMGGLGSGSYGHGYAGTIPGIHNGMMRNYMYTGDWDNSFATNSPGQSGDPDSKFYDNLYEDWANDIYFPLLYSKSKILRNLENRKVYYPQD